MTGQKCTPTLISGSKTCEIWACKKCNTIHLSIGFISMKLRMEDFMDAAQTIHAATNRLTHLYSDASYIKDLNSPQQKIHH